MGVTHIRGGVWMIEADLRRGQVSTYVAKGERAMVIDPGPARTNPSVARDLESIGIEASDMTYIGVTHIHLDHAGGAWGLLENYPRSRLHVHPRGAQHMVDPARLVAAARALLGDGVDNYGEVRGVPPHRLVESRDGEVIDLGGAKALVQWTPGHASHHQCYFMPEERLLLLGDAGGLYSPASGAIRPTSPPPFSPPRAIESLDRLIALGPEVVCYAHRGFAEEGVEKLRAHRNQIMLWSRIVEEGVGEGLDYRELYERILLEDPLARREAEPGRLDEAPPVSIAGLVEYFRWIEKHKGVR